VASLRALTGKRSDVHVYEGDCNQVLLTEVFPKVRYEEYRRGLCLLDPYGLHLTWEVIQTAGQMRSIDLFLNFPVADMNRNVLWHNPEPVAPADIERMNAFWGDDSWRKVAYTTQKNLFAMEEKAENETIAAAFRERLRHAGEFKHVPDPLPMRNSKGAVVYYLFFASQNDAAERIIRDIFKKYSQRGIRRNP
jgi:three-Cys-motif partner protein